MIDYDALLATIKPKLTPDLKRWPDKRGKHHADCPNCGKLAKKGQDHFYIKPDIGAYYCWVCKTGGKLTDLAQQLGVDPAPYIHRNGTSETPYDYTDEAGDLLYQNVRYYTATGAKKFYARQPDSRGGWIRNITSPPVRRVLYRLADVIAAVQASEPIYIVEGEKDANTLRLYDLTATTNDSGAGHWRAEYDPVLKGADVIILPDNDKAGQDHADDVERHLSGVARSVQRIPLPGLPPKGDVSDWLLTHTIDELLALVHAPPPGAPVAAAPAPRAKQPRKRIKVADLDIPTIARSAWDAVIAANDPPTLYRHGGALARLEIGDSGATILVPIDRRRLRGILARCCLFTETSRGAARIIDPPSVIVDDMLVNIDPRLPLITRIVHCPIFDASGALLDAPGYHPTAAVYYDPPAGVLVPPVPNNPTDDDLARAKTLILTELLGDFPFVSEADRAHAVALLLLPIVRELIDGPTPLHLLEAATVGSGKGLLASVLLTPALGAAPPVMPAATDDDEWRKRITSTLLAGPQAILIDNLTQTLGAGSLAAALTGTEWADRRLGLSETIRASIRCAWAATGNNPVLSTEIARRSVRVRIDPKVDQPWTRTGFRHEKLQAWALAQRGDLIWAALTLIRYGLQHGAAPTKTLGSYESWAGVIGRILDGVGVPGFLANLDELYERADAEMAAWRALVGVWWEKFQGKEKGAADLYDLLDLYKIDLELHGETDRALRTSFGMLLARMRDRVLTTTDELGGIIHVQIAEAGKSHRLKQWRLIQTDGVPNVPSVPISPEPTRGTREVVSTEKGTLGTLGTPDIDEPTPFHERVPDADWGTDAERAAMCLDFARAGKREAAEFLAHDLADARARDDLMKQIDVLCGAAEPADLPIVYDADAVIARLKAAAEARAAAIQSEEAT